MATQSLARADVERILDLVVRDPSYGLDYAVFLRDNPLCGNYSADSIVARAVGPSLERQLGVVPGDPPEQKPGFGRTAKAQREWWDAAINSVRESFQHIKKIIQTPKDEVTPTRLVFDVEMGGLLCALADENGWVFAATLSQEAMNDGYAERGLVKLVQELQRLGETTADRTFHSTDGGDPRPG